MLTDAQIAQYHEDGYLMLGKILTDAQIAALCADEKRFRESPLWPDSQEQIGKTIFRSQLAPYSAAVRDAGLTGSHVPLVQQLIGPNVIYWFSQFVTKYPDAKSGKSDFPWHQDNGYSKGITPATNITVWVALEDVNEQNGCVYVMPNSHKGGLRDHGTRAESWHLTVAVEGNGVPAILKAGEAVAFTGLTLHRSLLNNTDQPRRGFFMEYADADAIEGVTTPNPRRLVERMCVYFVSGQATLDQLSAAPPLG